MVRNLAQHGPLRRRTVQRRTRRGAVRNGNDTLTGTGGADLLLGQNGDDTLGALGASDVLCGANGDDRLTGGGAADSFDGGSGTDTATDFNAGEGDSRTNIP